jgi:cytochrome c oxidase assembly protein subunit 15
MNSTSYNSTLHRIALLTACATFPLIFMGGLVTSHGAGLAVPDWPNSYGYNMFLFPPRLWIGNIFYEHTHRLMAIVVGILSIALAILAWMTEPRVWVRWLCTAVLACVILQGVLGGLRVVLLQLNLAIVHACFAQAFFCLAALAAIVTSRWWANAPDQSADTRGRTLIALAAACGLAVYLQLIAGALMRHNNAGLAIPDLPLAYGQLLPPTTTTALDSINANRVWRMNLERVTLTQVWMHFSHRIGAIIVSLAAIGLAVRVLLRHREQRGLVVPAITLLVLLAAQVTLGVCTVIYRKPADLASAHVAVGALLLLTTFVLLVRAMRLFAKRPAFVERSAGFAVAGLQGAH